jgi:hypothetical protein
MALQGEIVGSMNDREKNIKRTKHPLKKGVFGIHGENPIFALFFLGLILLSLDII